MLRASLAHDNATIVFNDLCFDLTGMLVHQRFERNLAGDDCIADFFYTTGTKTIGLARETQRWSAAFVGLEQWTRRPGGPDGLTFGESLVDGLECFPGDV